MTMKICGILLDLDETLHSRENAFWAWVHEEAAATPVDLGRVAARDARGRGAKPALLDTWLHALRVAPGSSTDADEICSVIELEGWLSLHRAAEAP